jgi:hypothetical protein
MFKALHTSNRVLILPTLSRFKFVSDRHVEINFINPVLLPVCESLRKNKTTAG